MRREASILHLDLDAFFAAVEQRDKPSLRGRPVVVGGVGGRGVVATASYEARAFGARSAMSTAEARRRCPAGTAFLGGRFAAYRRTSEVVMTLLRELSPLVEPVSIDEAYVDLAAKSLPDLVALAGRAHGAGLFFLARAEDDRAVVPDREAKSVSAEETFERDLTDLAVLGREIDAMAARVGGRLRASAYSGRTVTLKLRRYDFTTITRSQTLAQPTDDARQIAATARRLLTDAGTAGGLRLLGVGVSGLSVYAQGDLFAEDDEPEEHPAVLAADEVVPEPKAAEPPTPAEKRWWPGQDVRHEEFGAGWVWGRGLGRVTVRFEGPLTAPGPVRTLAADDPALTPADPPDWRPAP